LVGAKTPIIKDTYLLIDIRFEHDSGNTIPEDIEIILVLKKMVVVVSNRKQTIN